MDDDDKTLYCDNCASQSTFNNGDDGFFYCQTCGSQAQDIMETAGELDDINGIYNPLHKRRIKSEPLSQSQTLISSFKNLNAPIKVEEKPYSFEDEISVPLDFGNSNVPIDVKVLANSIRLQFVEGMQVMIQMQCEALVEKFRANASICGLSGVIWLRYVAASGIFDEQWVADAIVELEKSFEDRVGKEEAQKFCKLVKDRHKAEPFTSYGRKAVLVWTKALKRRIPLASSLAICFLACHVAREAILPTDILKWALEGELPYIAAFIDIEKKIGRAITCPLYSRRLFRPIRANSICHLESLASSVAERIGLRLPPVNFYSIAHRYLRDLFLPVDKILPHANSIYEWSMPPDLWLSTRPSSLPTRVCVMSILIVAIRILYDINGLGKWEMSLSSFDSSKQADQLRQAPGKSTSLCDEKDANAHSHEMDMDSKSNSCSSHVQNSELDTTELLCNLEMVYHKLTNKTEYSKDLRSYLKYCKDVVFAGETLSYEEENIAEQLWNIFEDQEDTKDSLKEGIEVNISNPKRPRDEENEIANVDGQKSIENGHFKFSKNIKMSTHEHGAAFGYEEIANGVDPVELTCNDHISLPIGSKAKAVETKVDGSLDAKCSSSPESALRRMKSNMEENMFLYVPPHAAGPSKDRYIHFDRKRKGCGMLIHAAHADYYILLRACAKLAQVDVQTMHIGVLKLERRLSWIEDRINRSLPEHSFKFNDSSSPEHSCKFNVTNLSDSDDSLDFSDFKFKM